MNITTGPERAYACSIAGTISALSSVVSSRWCSIFMTSKIGSTIRSPYRAALVGGTPGFFPSSPTHNAYRVLSFHGHTA